MVLPSRVVIINIYFFLHFGVFCARMANWKTKNLFPFVKMVEKNEVYPYALILPCLELCKCIRNEQV